MKYQVGQFFRYKSVDPAIVEIVGTNEDRKYVTDHGYTRQLLYTVHYHRPALVRDYQFIEEVLDNQFDLISPAEATWFMLQC